MAEEKIKKIKIRKNSNLMLILFSAVVAFVLWIFLAMTAFPEQTVTIKDIPIDFSLDGSFASVANISVMKTSVETVNVRFTGKRFQVGGYGKDDIHVGVNLDPVRATGSYDLSLIVTSVNGDPIEDILVEPSTVKVDFDYMVTKRFSVEDGTLTADISKISAAAGYVIDPSEVIINPSYIEMYGPRDYMDQITSCAITATNPSTVQKTVVTSNTSIVMYNKDNDVANESLTENIQFPSDAYELTVPVYFKKDLKLNIGITKMFDSFDLSSLKYRIEPESITVRSQNENIKNINDITLDYIDLNRINIGTMLTLNINDNSNYTNISGNDSATVYFDLEGYSSKKVTIRGSQIYIINKPADMRVNIEQDKIRNVTLVGPSEIIESIDSTDVVAQIDMLDYRNTDNGYAMFYLTIFVPKYNNVWCYGTYPVYCNVEHNIENLNVGE